MKQQAHPRPEPLQVQYYPLFYPICLALYSLQSFLTSVSSPLAHNSKCLIMLRREPAAEGWPFSQGLWG